jgi:hypothetical protein
MTSIATRLCILAGGLAILTACVDTTDVSPTIDTWDWNPTDTADPTTGVTDTDTEFYDGAPMFQEGTWTDYCESDLWSISASTDGWVYGTSLLNIYETRYTKDYDEEHAFNEEAVDPNGYWSDLATDLTTDTSFGSTVSGSSTFFLCAELGVGNSDRKDTVAARVYDIDNNLSDCIVWGQDPSVVLSNGMNAGIQVPSEITDNCVDVN